MIIVTGMHRSGTSLIAHILSEYGISFGADATFYRPDAWNVQGYFEQRDIIDLNSRIVCRFPRTQSAISRALGQLLYLRMPGLAVIERRGHAFADEISALDEKYRDMGVKDPRYCVTLKQWTSCCHVDACVVCLRSPWEIVASLKRRQRIPPRIGLRFWHYHMAALLDSLPHKNTIIVHYNELTGPGFEPELERLRLGLKLELTQAEAVKRFRKVYTKDFYHCREDGDRPLPPESQEVWDAFLALHQCAAA